MLKTASAVHISSDAEYAAFERLIAERVSALKGPLFTTDADGLFDAYLAGIPESFRQHYRCHCCRRFITNYGGIVGIHFDGTNNPFLLSCSPDDVPLFFQQSVEGMRRIVKKARITGVFINGDKVWGNPQTGVWTHLSGTPSFVHRSPLKTAFQVAAEKTQDYITLKRGLSDFPLEAVVQAVRVLQADAVDRSEKTLGIAEWLLALHQSIVDLRGPLRDNLIWLAVANAPPGWCHIRSTMISTLLDDVIQGLPFESIKARWDAKMHPLRYQRPISPPKEGNIEQANKIVAALRSEGAWHRRFARLDEVTALWTPRIETPAQEKSGGAFDHLKAKSAIKPVELPAVKMTWDKFRANVLPLANEIEVNIAPGSHPFYGLVTAVNSDAPPILQWDGIEGLPRNPVSWYFWANGSLAREWGLDIGWSKVSAVCLKPCHWQVADKVSHQGSGVFFVLSNARDSRDAGGCFFPETLRAEYHGIRSVMEAHSRSSKIAGKAEGNANGIALTETKGLVVRVKAKDGVSSYSLSL